MALPQRRCCGRFEQSVQERRRSRLRSQLEVSREGLSRLVDFSSPGCGAHQSAILDHVIKYESTIHEFDPYFNYRVTQVPIGESDWRNCLPRPYIDSRNDVVVG